MNPVAFCTAQRLNISYGGENPIYLLRHNYSAGKTKGR
jgi:hypothetical protein